MLLSRPISYFVLIALVAVQACSKPDERTVGGGPATLRVSTNEVFAAAAALPTSGPDSLTALYGRIGAMSFSQYHSYLEETAVDASVELNGFVIGNPKEQMRASTAQFAAMDALFPTVSAWWKVTGFVPPALPNERAFSTALAVYYPVNGLGLDTPGTAESTSDPFSNEESAPDPSALAVPGSLTGVTNDAANCLVSNKRDFNALLDSYGDNSLHLPPKKRRTAPAVDGGGVRNGDDGSSEWQTMWDTLTAKPYMDGPSTGNRGRCPYKPVAS